MSLAARLPALLFALCCALGCALGCAVAAPAQASCFDSQLPARTPWAAAAAEAAVRLVSALPDGRPFANASGMIVANSSAGGANRIITAAHVVATLDLHRGAWLAVYSSHGQYLGRATLAARAAPGPAFGLAAGSDAVGLRFGDTAVLDMAAFAPGAAEAYRRIAGLPLATVQPRAMLEGVLAVPAGVDHGVSGAGVVVDGAIAGVMAFKAIDAAMKLVTIRAGDAVAQPRANVPAPLRSIRLPRQATAYAQPVIDNAVLAGLGTAGQRVGAVRSTLAVEVFVPGFVHDACVGFRGQMQPG